MAETRMNARHVLESLVDLLGEKVVVQGLLDYFSDQDNPEAIQLLEELHRCVWVDAR